MPIPVPSHQRVRRGFTLIEMLVVIGIILIFLGLSIGAVMRTPTVNKLIGTEQMMADVVRQARHTARSTGSPVEIVVSKAKREITGVSQIPVWNETFETPLTGIDPTCYSPLGQTGIGLICPLQTNGVALFPPPYVLTRDQSLARNPAILDGFYLAAAVNPVDANGAQEVDPLLQLGGENDTDCCCGLALWNENSTIQQVTQLGSNQQITASYNSWDVVGWITDSGGYHAVRSIEDSIITPATYLSAANHDRDVDGPIVGNRWEEFGLLYDGQVLELYRNGRLIARNSTGPFTGIPANATSCGGPMSVAEGVFTNLPALFNAQPTPKRMLQGTLDNLRLLRLGTDRAGTLPSGVTPDDDYRLTVRPDGIVEHYLTSPPAPSPSLQLGATVSFLIIGESSVATALGQDKAVIVISSDGAVTNSVTASGGAP